MFNREPSHAGFRSRPARARDSKTNDLASRRRVYDAPRRLYPPPPPLSPFQGRTLTSIWGESVGWVKGVSLHRRLIHSLAPLTPFRVRSPAVKRPPVSSLNESSVTMLEHVGTRIRASIVITGPRACPTTKHGFAIVP